MGTRPQPQPQSWVCTCCGVCCFLSLGVTPPLLCPRSISIHHHNKMNSMALERQNIAPGSPNPIFNKNLDTSITRFLLDQANFLLNPVCSVRPANQPACTRSTHFLLPLENKARFEEVLDVSCLQNLRKGAPTFQTPSSFPGRFVVWLAGPFR